MKPNNEQKTKVDKRFQRVWETFKDHHKTEGYKLVNIFELYLPFWQCKQNVVVEKDIELDRFSRIIMELINNNISKHSEICKFLGVDDDSFVTVQFHFLLKNDLIREIQNDEYEVTFEGIQFLQNKTKIKNIETVEFEYFITEKMDYLKNDLTQDFFNPMFPIDTQLSVGKKSSFSGYEIMQSHRIQINENAKEIPHKQKPTFKQISEKRNDFSTYFNKHNQDKYFYDFADQDIEAFKRNIAFFGLLFEKEENKDDRILEVRHSTKSVKLFKNNDLEKTLTDKATKYLMENPKFV